MASTAASSTPIDTPPDVDVQPEPREPMFDPQAKVPGSFTFPAAPEPPHRLVVIGDSLSHGFQSGAIYNTDLSYPAIIAYELGWFDHFRYPKYGGPGGLPLNIEYLLRDLERRYGDKIDWWEIPGAVFHGRELMDQIEDYWERGAGSVPPTAIGINHDLSVYGWDLRDALARTYQTCLDDIGQPKDDLVKQVVQSNGARAALRVYPSEHPDATLFGAAELLGDDTQGADAGIETLIVFLGANNALQTVTKLKVAWSGDDFADLGAKGAYTVWRPDHFASELAEAAEQVKAIKARHVIWCTVPHVTVPPISRGIGQKLRPGSRYYPFYTRPWVDAERFDPRRDPCITGDEARAVDSAIDQYNDGIVAMVAAARKGSDDAAPRDWLVLDVAGLLDRLASRRYIEDVNARPAWWSQYPLPGPVAALKPTVDSRFTAGDGEGGRAHGGLFSLDGVHPTTVGYGMIAQELITIMRGAGVEFRHANQSPRSDPVTVDFDRLIRRDTLVRKPPQNLAPGLKTLGWADEALDLVRNAVHLGP
jgi:hypothetical protein